MIRLQGLLPEIGVVMLVYVNQAVGAHAVAGRLRDRAELAQPIVEGVQRS